MLQWGYQTSSLPSQRSQGSEEQKLRSFEFSFANVTSWNQSVQQFFLESGVRCFLIQEHRLLEPDFQRLQSVLRTKGYQLTGIPARATDKGGHSGGVFIAAHHSLQATPGPSFGSGPSWTVVWVRLAKVQLALVSLYLKDGEGPYGDTNCGLLEELAAFLRAQAGPWLVAGDWNCAPEELISTTFCQLTKGHVVRTRCATISSGNELDFCVVHRDLQSVVQLELELQVPWKPHFGLRARVDLGLVLQPLPHMRRVQHWVPCEGPRLPWEYFKRVQCLSRIEGPRHPVNCEVLQEEWFTAWSLQFEDWLLSTCVEPAEDCRGRGTVIGLVHKPKLPPKPLNVHWKDRTVSFWHGLHRIAADLDKLLGAEKGCVNLKQKLFCALSSMAGDLHKHWLEPIPSAHFQVLGLQFALNSFGVIRPFARDAVLEDLEAHSKAVWQAERRSQRNTAHQWTQQSLRKGGRLAHQSLKAGEVVLERPFVEVPVQDRPRLRREYWAEIWGEVEPRSELSPARIALKSRAVAQAETLSMISSTQLMLTLRSMARKKPGLDAWTVQDLLNLPEPGQADLVYQLRQAELRGTWPIQIQHVAIAMLPKDHVAERPIALTSILYRCWNKCRNHLLTAWIKSTQHCTAWDRVVPGGHVEVVSQERQLRAEASTVLGLSHAVILLDLKHFYDHISLELLVARGLDLSYPPLLLQMAISVHEAARWILAEDLTSEPVLPAQGILAGCPQAVCLARLFLRPIVSSLTRADPRGFASTWVDDIGVDPEDADAQRLARRTVMYAKRDALALQDNQLCVSFKNPAFFVLVLSSLRL